MIEKVEFEVNIIDNMLEIIPVNGVKNNSIYEISVKGLKPYIKENYVDELSFTLDNSNLDTTLLKDKNYNGAYVNDVKIKFVTAMAPMYCQIIDVESLLEIVDIPSDIILYNIREASKYADYDSIDLSEVAEEGFIMMADTRPIRSISDQFCLEAGFTPNIVFESVNFESVRSLISAGLGVGFWPEYSWGKMKNKNIALLPISSPVCQRDLIFELRDRTPKSEKAEEFYKFLLKQFQMR